MKTSKSQVRRLPISQKAYKEFRARIIRVNDLFGLDPHHMLWLFEEYLCGRHPHRSGGGLACDAAFMMLCYDIERAIARSARARENARLRRARKERERAEAETASTQEKNGDTACPPPTDSSAPRPVSAPTPAPATNASGPQKLTAAPKRGRESSDVRMVTSSARGRRCGSGTWCGGAG